jgi:VanZ family protein
MQAVEGTPYRSFSAKRFFLLIAIVLTVVSTLSPFESSFSRRELMTRFQDGAVTSLQDLPQLGAHLVVFFSVGCLIVSVYGKSRPTSGFWRFAMLAVLFCAALELVQFFQLSRHARMVDFMCNSAGLILGMRTAVYWPALRACGMVLERRAHRWSLSLHGTVLIIATTLWSFAGLRPLMGSLTMDWNASYPLVVANERDGSRPWLGEIQYIGIYDRALRREEISFASFRQGALVGSGLLTGYDFTLARSTEVWPQGSLRSPDLVLQIPPSCAWEDDGGIVLKEGTVLRTPGPASELTKAISTSGAFSIEAWVRPANQAQTGPARIVGISDSIWRRNFTLGQEDSSAVFRVRNTTNGPNGSEHELQTNKALQLPLQCLIAIYDHGVSMIFRDGRLLRPILDLRETNLILGLGPGPFARLAAGILLAVLVALPAYSLLGFIQAARVRHAAAVLSAAAIGFFPYALSCLLFGGPWRYEFFLWVGAALLLAYPLSFSYVCRRNADMLKSRMVDMAELRTAD